MSKAVHEGWDVVTAGGNYSPHRAFIASVRTEIEPALGIVIGPMREVLHELKHGKFPGEQAVLEAVWPHVHTIHPRVWALIGVMHVVDEICKDIDEMHAETDPRDLLETMLADITGNPGLASSLADQVAAVVKTVRKLVDGDSESVDGTKPTK